MSEVITGIEQYVDTTLFAAGVVAGFLGMYRIDHGNVMNGEVALKRTATAGLLGVGIEAGQSYNVVEPHGGSFGTGIMTGVALHTFGKWFFRGSN